MKDSTSSINMSSNRRTTNFANNSVTNANGILSGGSGQNNPANNYDSKTFIKVIHGGKKKKKNY